jgi:hypothetical protein
LILSSYLITQASGDVNRRVLVLYWLVRITQPNPQE